MKKFEIFQRFSTLMARIVGSRWVFWVVGVARGAQKSKTLSLSPLSFGSFWEALAARET